MIKQVTAKAVWHLKAVAFGFSEGPLAGPGASIGRERSGR